MTTPLPAAPSLEQLRKQAKELVRERRGGSEPLRLSDAQLALAREYGFPSWPKLKAYVDRVSANGPALTHAFVDDIGYYEDRAEGLRSVVESGLASGIAIVRTYHPALTDASDAEIRALSRGDARLVLAREHGFASWAAFRRHVDDLAESGEPFRRAFRAIQARDGEALGALLDRYPGLVSARGTNGNDLLGLAANAVCGRRDQAMVRELLARGADPDGANDRGWTALHQAGYGNDIELARLLLDSGARADLEAHGEGGTPLAAALFWGHAKVADFLAERGIVARQPAHRGRTRPAGSDREPRAGGREPARRGGSRARLLPPAQRLSDLAAVGRSSGDPRRGARLGSQERPRGGARPARRARRRRRRRPVPRHRADLGRSQRPRGVDRAPARARRRHRSSRHVRRPDHGQGVTALHLAAQSGQAKAVEALLAAGADPWIVDAIHGGRPSGWADFGGHPAISKMLYAAEGAAP